MLHLPPRQHHTANGAGTLNTEAHAALGSHDFSVSPGTFLSWRQQATAFEEMAFFVGTPRNIADEGTPDVLQGVAASTNLLPLLGVHPLLGRGFNAGDGKPGTNPVVILSHDAWQIRYASAPDIIGRIIRLDGTPTMVVGVH